MSVCGLEYISVCGCVCTHVGLYEWVFVCAHPRVPLGPYVFLSF